ncbi:alpha-L-fucosidase [Pedobacter miscanthi]|uniref:alpha-L-fucosidase n=1 Tax=Pedobacter miscanthi TaxID=2259170 RepID=UPI00292DD922|nr:alpha-L-fucosidase [Pedobacter miscanthi]
MMNKKTILTLFICFTIFSSIKTHAQSNKMQWWQDGKFGLFLHWGLYSIGEWNGKPEKGNEHFMFYEKIPLATYAKIGQELSFKNYNADFWVKNAKEAGMKYVVITAKHHDGFAMFNSPGNDFNIVKKTAFAKDPMVDLAKACKKYGLKLCFYYSLGRDWESPDAYWAHPGSKSGNDWDFPDTLKKDNNRYIENKVKPQLKELLTQYGPVGIIWFDTPEGTTKVQSEDLRKFILNLQPNCIINSRIGNNMGDYGVAEQKIESGKVLKPWESCITMSGKWGYSKFDKNWKSPELLVRNLVEIVCKGGNLLLNVGPTNLGDLPEQSVSNLQEIGKWMKVNGEAIYGTVPFTTVNEYAVSATDAKETMGQSNNDNTSKKINPDLYFNQKGNNIYVFARSWTSASIASKVLAQQKNIKSITMLGSTEKVKWQLQGDSLIIDMPQLPKSEIPVYVFKVSMN